MVWCVLPFLILYRMNKFLLVAILLAGLVPGYAFAANTHSTDLVKASSQAWYTNSHSGLATSSAMSTCAWVNIDNVDPVNIMNIVGLGTDTSIWFFFFKDAGLPRLGLAINNTQSLYAWTNHTSDTWYHLCARFDGTQPEGNRVEFYVNGTSMLTTSNAETSISTSDTEEFAIGTSDIVRPESDSHRYFDGQIDDVRIWTRALSDSEVSAIYADSCSGSLNGANLGGWWKFDNDATDSSGNGNNLTGLNAPTFTTDRPFSCEPAPTIAYFNASPGTITSGGSSDLSWSVSSSTSVSINQGIGTVSASSTVSVSPAVTTTYILTASNQGLATSTDTVTVTVNVPVITSAVRKSADESVTASATLQADNELFVTLEDGKTYFVEGALFVSSTSATPDMRVAFNTPGGSEFDIGHVSAAGAAMDGGTLETSGASSVRIQIPANIVTPVMIKGTVVAGANDTLALSWAQFASNAAAVIVRKGSYLKIEEL